jgi:hypothetical protein
MTLVTALAGTITPANDDGVIHGVINSASDGAFVGSFDGSFNGACDDSEHGVTRSNLPTPANASIAVYGNPSIKLPGCVHL